MSNAVLVIDMLRGFLEEGPLYCGDGARGIVPQAQRLLRREREAGSQLIYVCDRHAPDDLEFKMFPPHCVAGDREAEIIPELTPYPGLVIPKTRYSGFYGTDLDQQLKNIRPERLLVCGTCTSICVLFTVADARNRDYPVDVYADCVVDFDEEAHAFALKHMERVLGARLVGLP